jgi:hypothetical protein
MLIITMDTAGDLVPGWEKNIRLILLILFGSS